jgi:pilus assembly protein Flp/PilA
MADATGISQRRKIMRELAMRTARGQGLVEYALIIALVAIVVIAALVLLGPAISSIFVNINTAL